MCAQRLSPSSSGTSVADDAFGCTARCASSTTSVSHSCAPPPRTCATWPSSGGAALASARRRRRPSLSSSLAAKRKRSIEAAIPQFAEQEKARRAIDEARADALATLVDLLLFLAQPIQRLPLWELVVVDPYERVHDAVNPNRVKLISRVLVRPSRLLDRLEDEVREAEAVCSAFRIYCEANSADINVAEWFRAFARVQWPDEDADIDDAFVDDAAPDSVSVSAPIAAKLHVFADAVLQLQHHGVVGAIHKSRGARTRSSSCGDWFDGRITTAGPTASR
jgi:hypothetical protein